LIAIAPLTFALLSGRTRPGPGHIVYFGVMAISFVVPAALYIHVSINLPRRASWPIIVGIVVASVHTIAALFVIGFVAWAIRKVGPVLLIPAFTAVVMAALSLALIRQLTRLFRTIHELAPGESAGFAPVIRS
jgi:hypothetical protein